MTSIASTAETQARLYTHEQMSAERPIHLDPHAFLDLEHRRGADSLWPGSRNTLSDPNRAELF
jgi:hypothetical protein